MLFLIYLRQYSQDHTFNPEHRELRATKTQHIYSTVFLKVSSIWNGTLTIQYFVKLLRVSEFGFFPQTMWPVTICSSWKSEIYERVDIFLQ